jgi:hypothetical protein
MVLVESGGVAALKSGDDGNPLLARCDNRLAPVEPSGLVWWAYSPFRLLRLHSFGAGLTNAKRIAP